jgi:hypothetical protein
VREKRRMMKRKTQEMRTSDSNDRYCKEGGNTLFADTFKYMRRTMVQSRSETSINRGSCPLF